MEMKTQKEISARFYADRKNNGLCPRCGNPLDREGHYCSECLEKVREYSRKNRVFYKENHLCTECGKVKVPGNEHICPECRAKKENRRKPLTEEQRIRYAGNFQNYRKALYQQRSELGICTRCGKRKAMPGKKKCGICLEKDAEIHRKKYMENPNVKEYRQKNNLCYYCGQPIDLEKGRLCSKCLEKCRENGKKGKAGNDYWRKDNRLVFGKGKEK